MKTASLPQNYRELIDNISGVIYTTDIRGQIEYASAGVYTLTGYTPEELVGQHFSLLVAPEYLSAVSDHYNNQVRTASRETHLEFSAISRTGEKKWVEQDALLLARADGSFGFQCFVRDISEKRRIQQQLRGVETRLNEQQLFLQSILDNTTSIFYVKDLQGRYLMVNRRFLEVLQLTEDQVIGHTVAEIASPEEGERYNALDKELLASGKPIQVEERLRTPDMEIHVLLTKFPLRDKNNKIYGISGIATDITERIDNRQQLVAAKTEAEEARRMQEQFLANMSHEIRTPMNGIVGMTNLLLETRLTPQQDQFAGVIRRSADNLLVIIDDILDLSKIKAGKLTIEKIGFNLQDVTANIWALFESRILKKGLTFEITLDPKIPGSLIGDPHRLNQVLINLVGNA
ncbi:MAG TPA: PAS domain S-box protein, partial [Puia sp.]|nr:PAS domain S-box protein [Puia sp.]